MLFLMISEFCACVPILKMKQPIYTYFKYGIAIILIVFVICLYEYEFNNPAILKNNKTSADYLLNDPSQQHHFQPIPSIEPQQQSENTTACNCSSSTHVLPLVDHGETTPLFVPDALSPLPPDILDKLTTNAHSDQSLIVTVANYGMRMDLYNWIKLLEDAKETQFVVFCTDEKLYLHLMVAGYEDRAVLVPDTWLLGDPSLFEQALDESLLDQDQPIARRLSHVKTWVLQRLVYADSAFNVLMLDVNQLMVHRRTREYIQALLQLRYDTQMIATQDSVDQSIVNTGLLMIRGSENNRAVKRVLASTIRIQEESQQRGLNQQEAFNEALDQFELHVKTGMMVLLDVLHFPNGPTYFDKKLPKSKNIKPYIIHVNHKFGEKRKELLRKHKLWKVNEDFVNWISSQVETMWQKRQDLKQRIEQEKIRYQLFLKIVAQYMESYIKNGCHDRMVA
ncbi:MAG: hypothetical protein EXX96DRAFT_543570 [Benjaminiella poitrasii]|nr:MAG: hypothetical protein EXX96DRAFT_543570 [Benjaminiella poitrasii]